MNGTMFNVVLPETGKEFQLIPSQVSWIMTSYMVVYAIGFILFGKLATAVFDFLAPFASCIHYSLGVLFARQNLIT